LRRRGWNDEELDIAKQGTVRTEGKGKETYLVHSVKGVEYRTKISTLRGDYRKEDGNNASCLRMWEKIDFKPRSDDIFQERLYCIQWIRPKQKGKGYEDEFRSITLEDLERETIVENFVAKHIADWQQKGWIPDMKIESGYNTDQPIRERGWTHWNHLFNPRQLFLTSVRVKKKLVKPNPNEVKAF
jgi:putative DNA methylase